MSDTPLVAHSYREIELFFMVTPCEACHQGPLKGLAGSQELTAASQENQTDSFLQGKLSVSCTHCGHLCEMWFAWPESAGPRLSGAAEIINATDEASRLIDVAQWLTLCRMQLESAEHERDKQKARRLRIDAGRCITEALQFYDEVDNDLPPAEAFFHEVSRRQASQNPDHFSRQKLINLRARLPVDSATFRPPPTSQR